MEIVEFFSFIFFNRFHDSILARRDNRVVYVGNQLYSIKQHTYCKKCILFTQYTDFRLFFILTKNLHINYDLGRSFFSLYSAKRETLATFTTCKRKRQLKHGLVDFSCFFPHLKTNSGNITDSMTFPTETGDQNLVVLFDVVEATVPWHERGDFLAVLD